MQGAAEFAQLLRIAFGKHLTNFGQKEWVHGIQSLCRLSHGPTLCRRRQCFVSRCAFSATTGGVIGDYRAKLKAPPVSWLKSASRSNLYRDFHGASVSYNVERVT